jgi:hypothetical protein
MAKSTDTCNSLLALVFNATTWTGMAENDTGTPLTNLWIALYTTPGPSGTWIATDSEVTTGAYSGYIRYPTLRSTAASGWNAPTGGYTKNKTLAQFPECQGGTGAAITHVAIVTTASGSGAVLYAGELSSPRSISAGIQPQFAAEALVVTET